MTHAIPKGIPKDFVPRQSTYTLSQTASALGASKRTVQRWIKYGLLRKSNASRRVLIPGEDVETFITRTS